jgi:hypothetical protein
VSIINLFALCPYFWKVLLYFHSKHSYSKMSVCAMVDTHDYESIKRYRFILQILSQFPISSRNIEIHARDEEIKIFFAFFKGWKQKI